MRQNWVGTPDHEVTLCLAVSSSQTRGSQGPGAGKTSVVGKATPVRNTAIIPKTWNIGLDTIVHIRGAPPAAAGPEAAGPEAAGPAAAAPDAGGAAPAAAAAALKRLSIAKLRMFRCDSVAPLGRPVVPDVNRMTAGESSVISARPGILPANSRASAHRSPSSRTGTPAGTEPSSRRASRRASPA